MFENIIQTSIFVRVLIFAIVSIMAINVIAASINFVLFIYMRVKKIQ